MKKGLGSKQGNIIRLAGDATPRSLVMGEGIETTLSVWLAMHAEGRDDEGRAFWCTVDLPNMGGRSLESVRHPTLKSAKDRAMRVPGPVPDLSEPGIAIPDGVTDVLLLGDGDSDRFTTECTLKRAAACFERRGRAVRVAWAPDGMDFNDMIMGRSA